MTDKSDTASPLAMLLSLGALPRGDKALKLEDPHSKRWVTFKKTDLAAIFESIRPDAFSAWVAAVKDHNKNLPVAAAVLVDEILTSRKNVALVRQLKMDGATMPATITLPPTRFDTPSGYYYPEKGQTAWFRAHGAISLDPNRLVRLDAQPKWQALLRVETEAYKKDPHTLFGIAGHGAFVYLLQAKRLNGRKYLFGKLAHDGQRAVRMTHWAKMVGANAATLIKRAGLDSSKL